VLCSGYPTQHCPREPTPYCQKGGKGSPVAQAVQDELHHHRVVAVQSVPTSRVVGQLHVLRQVQNVVHLPGHANNKPPKPMSDTSNKKKTKRKKRASRP